MPNKISVIIDATVDKAVASINQFRTSINEAEGAGGKFKAGMSSAFDIVKKNAGLLAVGAGTALVGFGAKAIGVFTDTAKAAIDLAHATGLSTEQASRWIAVGDDFQVSAEALATGLGKVAKTLDSDKWEKYGIATRDASGAARSANDILLDSFNMLSGITNETDRARVGQELFGKGYQSLTPILGHTREEYEKMLGTVEKGQVINAGEAAQAEKMRLAQDQMADAFKDVAIQVGGLIANLAPLLTVFAKTIGVVSNVTGAVIGLFTGVDRGTESFARFFAELDKQTTIKAVGDELHAMSKAADESHNFFSRLWDSGSRWDLLRETINKLGEENPEALNDVVQGLQKLKDAADAGDPSAQKLVKDYGLTAEHLKELATSAIPKTVDQVKLLSEVVDDGAHGIEMLNRQMEFQSKAATDAAKAADDLAEATRDAAQAAIDAIPHSDDLEQATRDLESSYYDLQVQIEANAEAQKDGKLTDEAKAQSARDVASAVHDQAGEVFALAQQYAAENGAALGSLESHKLMRDSLELSRQQYPELRDELNRYIAMLNLAAAAAGNLGAATGVGGIAHGAPGYSSGGASFASGVARVPGALGQPFPAMLHGGEAVIPAGGNAGGGGPLTVIIQMPLGSDGDDVIRKIEKWRNRNGNTKWMAS